jgi:glycosyltransferase involved in cell wall biosynthesis
VTVSVVVPTVGRSPRLRASVQSMLRAAAYTGADAEVLVVANGCDRVPALEHLGSPLLRVVFLDQANVSRARNVGIELARHHTVVFGDDAAAVTPQWCAELAGALRDPRYPVVTAPVRVRVTGPVTAFMDYQRVFDAPAENAVQARTVTGHCALRRDRLPATARYDEANLPAVGEDRAFGELLRGLGVRIRWLGGAVLGWGLLTDRIEEISGRALRYGRGGALIWSSGGGGAAGGAGGAVGPSDVASFYQRLCSPDHLLYRRFSEVVASGWRAAFTAYDYLYDAAYLLGYLTEWGAQSGERLVELDEVALRGAWREVAARAAAAVEPRDGGSLPPVDYRRLSGAEPEPAGLVDELREAFRRYAPLIRQPDPPHQGGATVASQAAQAEELKRLLASWKDMYAECGTAGWDDAGVVDNWARSLGYTFRGACASVERASTQAIRRRLS